MGKKELENRDEWQRNAGFKALKAERDFYEIFQKTFKGTHYILHKKPTHLKNLYAQVVLSPKTIREIFNPPIDLANVKWGVSPDFAIENINTGKILFGEIKHQDGWVEGKNPSAGRGNAHERLCKLFTPGLQKAYRLVGKIDSPKILPFWVIFEGDITRDPKRVREIAFWFDQFDKNYFMWRPGKGEKELINHFNRYLKPYLD